LEGLGGFHGSVHLGADTLYYAVGIFSEGDNGIVAFDQPWKNVVATFYHELIEARTDADVEDNQVAWVNNERPSEEIGDIPMTLAGTDLSKGDAGGTAGGRLRDSTHSIDVVKRGRRPRRSDFSRARRCWTLM
jgi:hypothetical protein